jgi:signal transduction histidine kinase
VTRRRAFGLRPRLLAALVFTSVVTLAVAALALLPPLQSRLTDQAANDLENATSADQPLFRRDIVASLTKTRKEGGSAAERESTLGVDIAARAFRLRLRTDARVIVASSVPDAPPIFDTDVAGSALPRNEILSAISDPEARTVRRDNQVIRIEPIDVPAALSLNPLRGTGDAPRTDLPGDFVLVTQKPLTDVATAVHQVRTAFLAAAAVGLLVAVLLGIALATGIGRRLARLRAAAVRVAEQGTDAPTPRDDGLDEVGDLARALATMQRELRRQEAARRSFVATASHELRTPIAAVYGSVRTLRRDDIELAESDREMFLQIIESEGERLVRIVDQILVAGQIDAGAIGVDSSACDVRQLVEGVLASARARAPESVTLDLSAPDALPLVACDENRLRQVLVNLVENAIKYSPDGGPIEVELATHGATATIAVRDRGLGIPAAEQERIFEKFYRLDPSMSRGVGGSGLGLYISRELVARMRGRLTVTSEPGQGSTFTVELPTA